MKQLSLALACALAVSSCWAATSGPLPLKDQAQKAAYAIGHNFGKSVLEQAPDIDLDLVQRGFVDAMKRRHPAMTEDEKDKTLESFQKTMMELRKAKVAALAKGHNDESKKFLAANAAKPGIIALPSGLQYQVITSGTGASPTMTDNVTVHYVGTLINGKVFDSSIERGQPATFGTAQVIKGWQEALQKMKVGDKWKLFIPPELAYGNRGAGGVIEPGSALIFDVELLGIQK